MVMYVNNRHDIILLSNDRILSNEEVNVYKGHLEENHDKPEGFCLS